MPLHRQIHDLVRQEIAADRLPPGTRLPSEEELADRWGVSLAPVRQALVDLAAEGYLDRQPGTGHVRPAVEVRGEALDPLQLQREPRASTANAPSW